MYTIHQSPALILDTLDIGEKNRFFWMFTRDYGLINASAQSVRSVTSKLNSHLQQYNFSTVEFVRGKDMWRITNTVTFQSEMFVFLNVNKNGQEIIARITSLVKRLYVGEEAHPVLFDEIYDSCLKISKTFDKETLEAIEILIMVKILYHLGYWEDYKETFTLHHSSFNQETFKRVQQKKRELQERIKQSLRESHL